MNHEEAEKRVEEIKRSPRSIQRANGCLLAAALLVIIHRTHYAYTHEIAIWKGLLVGVFLAFLIIQGGLLMFQRKKWGYWLILLISFTVMGVCTIHGLAELMRFAQNQSEEYIAFVFTLLYAVLSASIIVFLLRRESRNYFRLKVQEKDEH
jgi:hypothetical protein